MSIINADYLRLRLPDDATDDNNALSDSVLEASAFVDTWTARHYDPWDDYDTDNDEPRAPREIVSICFRVASIMYYINKGQVWYDRNNDVANNQMLDYYKQYLLDIQIAPTWKEQTISLDSNNAMLIGDRNRGGGWTRVIPFNAQVISGSSNVWIQPDDWEITQGTRYDDEYYDAWYLYAESSSVEGTLRYMKTYRNDYADYSRYNNLNG